MLRRILLASTALVTLSGFAAAADLTHKAPPPAPPPPVFTWTGFYIGLSAGYAHNEGTFTDQGNVYGDGVWNSIGEQYKASGDGGIFGIDAGYNYQTGSLVFGLETDIAAVTASGKFTTDYGYEQYKSSLNSLGTIRGRLGYAVDRALFYVTGGFAYGDVKNKASYDPADYGSAYVGSTSGVQTGWTAGGGIEYAFTPNLTIRGEALYVDLGKTHTSSPGCVCSGCRYGFKDTAVVARVGLNYKY